MSFRALIVDDDGDSRDAMEAILRGAGVTATSVDNGRDALDVLAQTAFGLVLMKTDMPLMDGLEVTRRLRRADGVNRDVPVLGLTLEASADRGRQCQDAGMNAAMGLPVTSKRLLNAICTVAFGAKSPGEIKERIALFEALANERRLMILGALSLHDEITATALTAWIPIRRQAVAKHLVALEKAKLVDSRHHGRDKLYSVRTEQLRWLAEWATGLTGRAG